MDRARPRTALLLALAAAACGGDEKPAAETGTPATGEAASPPPAPAGGLKLDSLREATSLPPAAPASPPAGGAPTAPAPAAGEAKGEPEKPAKPVPQHPSEITDAEVLEAYSDEEREALAEMGEKDRKEFLESKRLELFQARGGAGAEGSGKMEESAVDPSTGMRGPARPEAPAQDLGPADLRGILEALKSEDPEMRAVGAEGAKRYEDKAVAAKHVAPMLKDPDAEVRGVAASTLGALQVVESIPALEAVLVRERNDGVRASVLRALRDIGGPDGVAALRKVVRESDEPDDRSAALGMLVDLKDASNVRDLVRKALGDLSPAVRQQAVAAIRAFALKDYASDLLPLLQDFSEQVIVEALRALGSFGTRAAAGPAIKILAKPDPDAENPEMMQDAAAEALKQITGEDFGYAGTLPDDERSVAIDAWKKWWDKNRDAWR